MSKHEVKPPYVYQPFGMQDREHWAAERIYAVVHESELAEIRGLKEWEAHSICDALNLGPRPLSPHDIEPSSIISPAEDVYAGRDAGGNIHIHVCDRCFTNSDLAGAINALDQLVTEAEMVERVHKDKGHPHYSKGLEMVRALNVRKAPDVCDGQ